MRDIKFRGLKDGCWYTLEFKSGGLRWDLKLLEELEDTEAKFEAFVQFTSLKDKNGVEIYEGDVVGDEFGGRVVKFIDGVFCLDKTDSLLMFDRDDFEVLGNIHQNPELLKEKVPA